MMLHGSQPAAGMARSGRTRPAVARSSGLPSAAPSMCSPLRSTDRTHIKARTAQLDNPAMQGVEMQETYDVYVHEPVPLAEGEEKHVISVLVSDESGLINRVAGVCARRGANIESLAVGLTQDKALFTIVVNGSRSYVATLCKNLSKLVNVRYVEDLTRSNMVEREMILFKIAAKAGEPRTEVMQLAQIFRAKVNDVSPTTISLLVAGDPGKLTALEMALAPFGIIEMARTGRVCLRRGELLNYQHVVPEAMKHHGVYHPQGSNGNGQVTTDPSLPKGDDEATWSLDVEDLSVRDAMALTQPASSDVYTVTSKDMQGYWQVQNILEPVFSDEMGEYEVHTLSIEVSDIPGVLNQVTGCIARRGYNLQSLAVGPSEKPNTSRITTVVPGDQDSIAKLMKQLSKLIYVQSLEDLTGVPTMMRELMLLKVRVTPEQRHHIRNLEQVFRAHIVDISANTMTLQVMGKEPKLRQLCELLEPYGILEIARTGRIALKRDSGVDSNFLSKMATQKVY